MMINKNDEKKDNNSNNTNAAAFSKKPVMAPEIKESTVNDSGLDEETIRNNIAKLSMNKGQKVPRPYTAKSPKPKKDTQNTGKKGTTWDPFIFGNNGNGPSKEEMMKLDRSQKPSDDSKDEDIDHHLTQFLPDDKVIGRSAGGFKVHTYK